MFLPRCPNGIYISPITGIIQDVTETKSYRVRVLLEVLAEYDCISDFNHRRLPISSISFDALETHQNRKGLVEGVVIVDDVIGNDLAEVLTSSMNALAKHQELSDGVDYHPYSNCIVRDLVHPGLYSYVKGVTSLRASAVVSEPTDSNSQADPSADFWGRRYEDSVYQWLSTYFNTSADGRCTIEDYINHLTPREHPVNSNLHESLARLFEQFLPYIESVYSYICAIQPMLHFAESDVEWNHRCFDSIEIVPQ